MSTPDPLALADRFDLATLAHRYAAAVDERDLAAAVALFTDDAVLVTPAPPARLDAHREHRGRAAIRAALAAVEATQQTFHAITGIVHDLGPEPGTATGRISCLAHHIVEVNGEARDVVWAVTYRDQCRRTAAGWRLTRRTVDVGFIESRVVQASSRGQD